MYLWRKGPNKRRMNVEQYLKRSNHKEQRSTTNLSVLAISDDPEEDIRYKTIEIYVIIPSELPQGMKFDIASTMIQLLNLKEVFAALPINDAKMYLMNFIGIFTLYILPMVSQEAIQLRLFPFSLIEEANLRLGELSHGFINT